MKEAFDQQAGIDWYNQLIIDGNTADERLAAAVEAKDAEIARWTDYAATLESERADAKAEIARLREALEDICGAQWLWHGGGGYSRQEHAAHVEDLKEMARAALAGSPDGED